MPQRKKGPAAPSRGRRKAAGRSVKAAPGDTGAPGQDLPFPVVAVGASAGGIEATSALLHALPPDTGMAFVVIQHLSPAHKSMLAGILGRATSMPVSELTQDTATEPNHVYVLPPNRNLAWGIGVLRLEPRTEAPGHARPVDHFMRSLAEGHGHKAIGVVLSGTANDGTLGLEEIKAAGGITFAQDTTAEQEGMPSSAIASGAVDYVLPPGEIARELARIARHPHIAPSGSDAAATPDPAFTRILEMLREGTGVDFSSYKRNTLHRRVTRRMVLHKLENLSDYAAYVQAHAEEVSALYQDVLINVTSFFRNPAAYDTLKATVFPRLTEGRNRHDSLRVWVLGCSTGEEAYSIAMAYVEYADGAARRVPMQVFATDVNGASIDRARKGVFSKAIAQDVAPTRLRRFFEEADGGYRVAKAIREMVVFARQNALSDPPFSRLDLVTCRNMLIYLEPTLQHRLIPLLHYALRPDGYLWLGGSETIGTYRDLFELVDAKNKIYLRKAAKRAAQLALPTPTGRSGIAGATALKGPVAPPREFGPDAQREAERLLLSRYAPPGVFLNEELEVIQFHGDTGPYLSPAPGRATLSFLKMLREGLMVAARGALSRARREGATVREEGLRVRSNGGWREVDLTAIPLRGAHGNGGYVVLFEEPSARAEERTRDMVARMHAASRHKPAGHDDESRNEITRLSQELSAMREYLQSVIEQQEAANEELQSANEEVQSANEELQSINEELETSKEELQSSNEELATVNDELQRRNVEITESNNDLNNLLSSVNMAIVMLGSDLRIRRFTPPAEKLLNLIQADIGRPLSDLKLSIDRPDLEAIIAEVIETVTPHESEVQDRAGRWYSLRVRPYRTAARGIEGVVILLVDIDKLKRAELSLRESEQRFEALADSAPVLIWLTDRDGCRFVNHAFEEFVGEREPEIRRLGPHAFVHPEEREAYAERYGEAVARGEPFSMRARLRHADGAYRWMKHIANPRRLPNGELEGYVGAALDITDMAQAEQALVELDRGKNEFLALLAHELRNPLSAVHNASGLLAGTCDARALEQARGMIDRQTTNMSRMIDDLLDISRITYGKIRLQPAVLDLVEVLRRVIEVTKPVRSEAAQTLSATLPDKPLYVDADAMRLEQVFGNLLVNATKYTRPQGRIWVTAELEAGPTPLAVVRVRDNGMGIEAALLPRIFDLFVQGEGSPDRARAGVGLGLTLAKRLVELHGGTIEAHSAGNALGSEFIVRLPLAEAPSASAPGAGPPRAAKKKGHRRVLIVDDNEDSAKALGLILTSKGHESKVVAEGHAVVAAARQFKPDAIVLDIGLPDMNGYEVARALRRDSATREARIIAVTGFGRDEDRARAQAAGIDMHMTKPVELEALLAEIGRSRGQRRR